MKKYSITFCSDCKKSYLKEYKFCSQCGKLLSIVSHNNLEDHNNFIKNYFDEIEVSVLFI